MSMEMTWLEFQLSTDNQNGRHLTTNFFSTFFSEFPRNLASFSCETKNEAAAAIFVLSILINRSYFQLTAFKPGIYRVTASAEGYLSACTVFFFQKMEHCSIF